MGWSADSATSSTSESSSAPAEDLTLPTEGLFELMGSDAEVDWGDAGIQGLEWEGAGAFDDGPPRSPFLGILDDGEQLIRKKAYYSLPGIDPYGFLNTDVGFGMIQKDSVYTVAGVEDPESRKKYAPSTIFETDTFSSWRYGEEPIVYKDSTLIESKSSEDWEWEGFKSFIDNQYQNEAFTCYREVETFLNWYDYTDDDLAYGFEWKNDFAEWRQSNQLRSMNRDRPPGTPSDMPFMTFPEYNVHAEFPRLVIDYDNVGAGLLFEFADLDGDGITMPVMTQLSGYHVSTPVDAPDWFLDAMRVRFKNASLVESNVAAYLDTLTIYVMNTGYTTVLKRALSSPVQSVTRFTKREFTSMASPTLSLSPSSIYTDPAFTSPRTHSIVPFVPPFGSTGTTETTDYGVIELIY